MEIITERRRDRPSTLEEIGDEMARRWGSGKPRMEIIRPGGLPRQTLALLVITSTESDRAEKRFSRESATLEWWQIDNHLLGMALAATPSEAAEQALASACRGKIAGLDLTVWFDRGLRKFRFFRRSVRDNDTYRPTGRELTL